MEKILLIDEKDDELGFEDKIKIHQQGLLHRAFSIIILNSKGELLLQKRAKLKYHSGGLWSNTCCSHQRQGEILIEATHRRLKEEMNFDCDLKEAFTFRYAVKFENGLIENELDHVFIGHFDKDPLINLNEAEDFKWSSLNSLKLDIEKNPQIYTAWFKIIIKDFSDYLFS